MIQITSKDMGFTFYKEDDDNIVPRILYAPNKIGRSLLAGLYNLSITPNMFRDLLQYYTFFVHQYKALCILHNEGHEEYYTSEDVDEFSEFVKTNTPCEVRFKPTAANAALTFLGETHG